MLPRRALLATCLGGVVSTCAVADAANPLNSSDRSATSSARSDNDTPVNVVPVFGGTTDIGFGVGEFAGIAHLRRGSEPYVWNLESAGLVTFKPGEGGGVTVPYGDIYLKLTIPRFLGAPLELSIRPSFTTERTLGYYGVGDASTDTPPAGRSTSYFWYERTHPSLAADLGARIADHVAARFGLRYTHDWMTVPPGSRLASDLRSGSAEVRSFLGPTSPHGVALLWYGVQWDDRDDEVAPHHGSYHQAILRLSPGGTTELPYRYGEATIDLRLFVPLGTDRLTLALRGVADLLFGETPVYTLARIDEEYAFGGPNEVRGIPAQRYAGKLKAFGSGEVRADVTRFHALGKDLLLGLVGFFDGGRVWADVTPHPTLDGPGLGLKYAVGCGVRLQSGGTFVLRGDVAWSPEARPLGGYFAVGQSF